MKTSVNKKTLIATLVLLYFGLAAQSAQAVETIGSRSCGFWISSKGKIEGTQNQTWFIGFLSGIAVESDKDFLHGTDNESLFLWLDNYCTKNPLQSITGGGYKLFLELAKQKRL
jgi:hypothetical protein